MSAFRVAQKLCALSDWSLTNLQLQKLLYLSHLLYLGENREPLILEHFQAWKFGPVLPQVYNRVKVFKDRPVLNIFYGIDLLSENDPVYAKEACLLKSRNSAQVSKLLFIHCNVSLSQLVPGKTGIKDLFIVQPQFALAPSQSCVKLLEHIFQYFHFLY